MQYIVIPLATILVAVIGSLWVNQGLASWYGTIAKPAWTPGGGVIGAVWTILYILIATSAILAYNKLKGKERTTVMAWFVVNGVLNAKWNLLFFSLHWIGTSLFEILVLEFTIVALIHLLWNKARIAAYLLIPYALWVAFASYLTYSVWRLQ